MNCALPLAACVFVMAAVKVVLPWSTCPIVPMFTCGLLRSNFSLAIFWVASLIVLSLQIAWMGFLPSSDSLCCAGTLGDDLFGDRLRRRLIGQELHRVAGPPLRHGTDVRGITEHLREW